METTPVSDLPSPASSLTHPSGEPLPASPPGPAALSCLQCKMRKVKCNRARPCCSRCAQQGVGCVYPSSRKKHANRRKNMTVMDVRLTQLEDRLNGLRSVPASTPDDQFLFASDMASALSGWDQTAQTAQAAQTAQTAQTVPRLDEISSAAPQIAPPLAAIHPADEASCPLQGVLTDVYFEKIHYAAPMLHKGRYMASLKLEPTKQSPFCLQFIIIALSALVSEYAYMATHFYQRARAAAEEDEQQGQGEHFVTLAHAQCWTLMANFEAQQQIFSRASVSLSRAVRLAQMLGIHRMDDVMPAVPSSLPAARDWCETEERRRTWWVIFCSDRFLMGVSGLPALIRDRDVHTRLPASEEAFRDGIEEPTASLEAVLSRKTTSYSSFAGRVLAAHLCNRVSEHIASPMPLNDFGSSGSGSISGGNGSGSSSSDSNYGGRHDSEDDRGDDSDDFWISHRHLDNELATLLLFLPQSLQLRRSHRCQNARFVNIMIQAAIICLHRAALVRAKQLAQASARERIKRQSRIRLLPAAQEILAALRLASADDIVATFRNPLIVFAAYMAALVLLADVADERSRQSEDDLGFLLQLLAGVGSDNAVTRSLAAQLAAEMKRAGVAVTAAASLDAALDAALAADGSSAKDDPLLEPCQGSSQVVFRPHRAPLEANTSSPGVRGLCSGDNMFFATLESMPLLPQFATLPVT